MDTQKVLVEAAGVEPDYRIETAQLIDSGNDRIGTIAMIAKTTVRSLNCHFPECPEHPNSTFGRPLLDEKSILKCSRIISQT
jgi:hypothetical protein